MMFVPFLNKKLLFIGWLLFSFCFADELKKIEIIGNNRLDSKSIISQFGFEIGDNVDQHKLNNALKNLHRTNFFSDVVLQLDDGALRVKVVENPVMQSLKIKGNKFISTSQIKKVLDIKNDTILNPAKLEQGVKNIKLLYKVRGRPDTIVQYEIIKKLQNVVDVIINIREAKAVKIGSIKFYGNEKFTDEDLKRTISSRDFSLLRIISSSYYYAPERLELDKEMLQRFYQSNGYFDFRVKDTSVNQDENWVNVTFSVHEGEQYKFGEVGVSTVVEGLKETLSKYKISIKAGDVFNINSVNKAITSITDYLNNNGYLFVNVTPEYKEDAENRIVGVLFNVSEARKIYIRHINIIGNDRTLDNVIRREFLLAERDPYNMNKIHTSRRRVLGLGFFDSVDITNKPIDDQNVDVEVKVREKTTGYINLSGGYSTELGVFGNFSVTEGNVFGTGNQIGLSLKRSIRDFEGSLDFNKAYLFDTNINGNFSLFHESNDKTAESSYRVKTSGFKLGTGYNITENLYKNVFYSFQSKNIFDVQDDAAQTIKDQAGKKNISMIGYGLTYNMLDNPIAPRSGYTAKLNQKFAGLGGDLNFVKTEVRVNYFRKVLEPIFGDKLVLNLISRGGYVFGYGDEQYVEIGQRFFMNEIRGFENSGVGPRDNTTKDALGGKAFWLNTVQLEFPLGLPKELDVKGTLFFDNGVLTGVDRKTANISDTGNFRNAIGAGIIWASPIGKIRVDAGYAITKDDYDKPKVIKFSVGSEL